ncbi:MAG: acyltransferase domain-containing protein, partial [Planctomycetes bacterium]|nr:acyltransferase domain-containing protein [Planctomycetota bacterium]
MNSQFLVLTPPQHGNAQLAIAAVRAGECGLLDLGMAGLDAPCCEALRTLAHFAAGKETWGVRWDMLGDPARPSLPLDHLPALPWPVLAVAGLAEYPEEMRAVLDRARQLAGFVLVEVYSLAGARMAHAAGCHGVILKGHESGGRVGGESAYLLLQQACGRLEIPFWVQGGMGPDTAAAALLAGGGVVLGEQLWLAEESPFLPGERLAWEHLDGSETFYLGEAHQGYRFFDRAARAVLQDLERQRAAGADWLTLLRKQVQEPGDPAPSHDSRLIPLGQEIAFAAGLARRYGTVGGILEAFRQTAADNLRQAARQRLLASGSPLACAHGTRYPIVQGPMTRVSDVVPFTEAVAGHGALPFLALALMRGPEVRALLTAARDRLAGQPWGVGILGFVPHELRQEQLAVIRDLAPPFALIAGGRPSQAAELESAGISTYLHVPSPGLLEAFLKDGARKFIFEGRECGGHVGPRSSFTLWQAAVQILRQVEADPAGFQVLFAGGIHDRVSAALAAAVAAPLAARGMKFGVLMGTAYTLTTEAVQTGAITPEFQRQALACTQTALLDSGGGHATRCMQTLFADEFHTRKRDLVRAGKSPDEIRRELELLNIGRLRLASKAVTRQAAAPGERGDLVPVDEATQRREGLFMIGQVVTLHGQALSLAELHADVCEGSTQLLEQTVARPLPWQAAPTSRNPREDLAIVGMACLFPECRDLRAYWQNILAGFDAVREVPPERWRSEDFFSADRLAADRIYSRWGAFLGDIVFDPVKYRIPPASLASIEPIQLLCLETAWQALEDAGYHRRDFPRERTAVIFGASGPHDLGMAYAFRTMLRHYLPQLEDLTPEVRARVLAGLEKKLPAWTEDSFPGFLSNVIAGRISNHLNLGGSNYVVDAACAASLAALHAAVEQLRAHTCDVALVGAADATNNPCGFMSFARTHALSPRGKARPFDDGADGIALGEGVAVIVLRRLRDAERAGDRIYAVLKGIGSASDGRHRSLTAPHPPGQVLALRRGYEDAGISPATVSLIEAHGTGTVVGDRAEVEALQELFADAGTPPQSCALGSVKSMIGHTKTAAGLAGLIKAVLALQHRVLPPTIHVEVPNRQVDFAHGPLSLNTETTPWPAGAGSHPRRAGVSAFGFGGTNFHAVLEEYTGAYHLGLSLDLNFRPAEVFAWARPTRADLGSVLRQLDQDLEQTPVDDLASLAFAVCTEETFRPRAAASSACRLALVAESVPDLRRKVRLALEEIPSRATWTHPTGLFLREGAAVGPEQVCFLFPGQGAQAVNMLAGLVLLYPEAHDLFAQADRLLHDLLGRPLTRAMYPVPTWEDARRRQVQEELNDTRLAQPALGLVNLFALDVLARFGLNPGLAAGHSYGEYVALCAAGVLTREELLRLSAQRGRIVTEACRDNPGGMAAVAADGQRTAAALQELGIPAIPANWNAPDQTIIAGTNEAIDAAVAKLSPMGLPTRRIPVTAAFHTPALEQAAQALAGPLSQVAWQKPRLKVFSNTTAGPYPEDPEAIRELLARHLTQPVLFEQ